MKVPLPIWLWSVVTIRSLWLMKLKWDSIQWVLTVLESWISMRIFTLQEPLSAGHCMGYITSLIPILECAGFRQNLKWCLQGALFQSRRWMIFRFPASPIERYSMQTRMTAIIVNETGWTATGSIAFMKTMMMGSIHGPSMFLAALTEDIPSIQLLAKTVMMAGKF